MSKKITLKQSEIIAILTVLGEMEMPEDLTNKTWKEVLKSDRFDNAMRDQVTNCIEAIDDYMNEVVDFNDYLLEESAKAEQFEHHVRDLILKILSGIKDTKQIVETLEFKTIRAELGIYK